MYLCFMTLDDALLCFVMLYEACCNTPHYHYVNKWFIDVLRFWSLTVWLTNKQTMLVVKSLSRLKRFINWSHYISYFHHDYSRLLSQKVPLSSIISLAAFSSQLSSSSDVNGCLMDDSWVRFSKTLNVTDLSF